MKTQIVFSKLNTTIHVIVLAFAVAGCATVGMRENPGKVARFQNPIKKLAIAQTSGEHAANASIAHGILVNAGAFEVFMPGDSISPNADHVLVITTGKVEPTLAMLVGVPQWRVTFDIRLYSVNNGATGSIEWNDIQTATITGVGDDLKMRQQILGERLEVLLRDYRQYQTNKPVSP